MSIFIVTRKISVISLSLCEGAQMYTFSQSSYKAETFELGQKLTHTQMFDCGIYFVLGSY